MNVTDFVRQQYRENLLAAEGDSWTAKKNRAWETLLSQLPEIDTYMQVYRKCIVERREAVTPDETLGSEIASIMGHIAGELKGPWNSLHSQAKRENKKAVVEKPNGSKPGDWFESDYAEPKMRSGVQSAVHELPDKMKVGDSVLIACDTIPALATALSREKRLGRGEFTCETQKRFPTYFANGNLKTIEIAKVTRVG